MEHITVQNSIKGEIQKVWEFWTKPDHIVNWNFASEDWQCPYATNDLKPNGKFSWRMEAKDGSMTFDYSGIYDKVDEFNRIKKTLDDGRKVEISFSENDGVIEVIETFEPDENDLDLQRQGWLAILDTFKKYVESH